MLNKLLASFVGHLKPNRAAERASETLELPTPECHGGLPLMEALSRRCSSREFQKTSLPPQVLSNLLWAAFGINRPVSAQRTAPSALNAQEVDIYVTMANGVYVYAPRTHSLHLVANADARRVTGYQDFVDEAPLDLVYVADCAHTLALPANTQVEYAAVSAGAIAQNVYLYCASAGLATVARAMFDRKALAAALHLAEHERVLLTQTVGYPLSG
ncbi:MAG TPA: SagB/ThcOx family dehydrogenase [Polyangiaceae bacterium]